MSREELLVDHEGQDIVMAHPVFGPDTYLNIKSKMSAEGLRIPTMGETASILWSAFNHNDNYCQEIRKLLLWNWLWTDTASINIPGKGIHFQDRPDFEALNAMEESELVKLLESDPEVRLVPQGHSTGELGIVEIASNAYLHGLVGKELTKKLSVIASRHTDKPYLWPMPAANKVQIGMSRITSNGFHDNCLGICTTDLARNGVHFAYGILDE